VFIDQAKIFVKSGSGGKGCKCFYRDKYTRQGIPDGGDGGRGADIIFKADRNLLTLLDFRYRKHFRGQGGGHGLGKNKKGKDASPLIVRVPPGTTIKDIKIDCVLGDLDKDLDQLIVAFGGKGGLGNRHRRCFEPTEPEPGEEKELLLDLKLIADVGIVGFPNAGKSTLISSISKAYSKVANYHFTTKSPVLGAIKTKDKDFIVADIPGLIEGSSLGKGLGDKFLRHVERTKILIHIVDMAGFEGRDPIEDYKMINRELKGYSQEVYKKKQIIAANKMDLEGAEDNLVRFQKAVKKKIFPISALKKEGLEELIEAVSRRL